MSDKSQPIELKMAVTTAPLLMKISHKNEFIPKSIFFLAPSAKDSMNNWESCLKMKAAAVFLAIFERQTNSVTLDAAEDLLNVIAQQCYALIFPGDKDTIEEKRTEKLKLIKDAIYLAVGFLHDIKKFAGDPKSVVGRENFDKYCMSRNGAQVLSDIAMIDNQLLLGLIKKVVETLPGALTNVPQQKEYWTDAKLEKLKPFLQKFEGPSPVENLKSVLKQFKLSGNFQEEVVSLFCWYYSPFYADIKNFSKLPSLKDDDTLLECLHRYIEGSTSNSNDNSSTVTACRTAKELSRGGVRFKASNNPTVAIEFKSRNLMLPALFWDSKLETVVMNLVALESLRNTGRPVTRYFQLLNELVNNEEDVRVLKECGVLKGKWRRDEDVVELVRRVDGFASSPSVYPAIDAEMKKVNDYVNKKKLFGRWVPFAAAAAATVVLTAVVVTKRRGSR